MGKGKSYNSDILTIEIQDEIVFSEYSSNLILDIDVAKHFVKKRLELQDGKDYPNLIKLSLNKVNKEARDYMNTAGLEGITAGAFIVDNFLTKTILNFYLSVYKPKVPAKLFNNEKEALKWLQKYK